MAELGITGGQRQLQTGGSAGSGTSKKFLVVFSVG